MLIDNDSDKITLNDINGLLIIDLWDDSVDSYIDRLKIQLDNLAVQSVIVCNYETNPSLNDPCLFNTIEKYGWSKEFYNPNLLANLLKECNFRSSHSIIKDRFATNSFLILDLESLDFHIRTSYLDHTKWLVVGNSWELCIHTRPTGLKNLKKLPYKFYVTDWSCFSFYDRPFSELLELDELTWIPQDNTLWRLKPDE